MTSGCNLEVWGPHHLAKKSRPLSLRVVNAHINTIQQRIRRSERAYGREEEEEEKTREKTKKQTGRHAGKMGMEIENDVNEGGKQGMEGTQKHSGTEREVKPQSFAWIYRRRTEVNKTGVLVSVLSRF